MTTSADRAILARALTHELRRAPQIKRAPLALGAVTEAGVFEGYASVFGVADLGRDVVDRGAFAASLGKRGAAQIKMLWQHDPGEPIGAWLAVTEDAIGLKVRGRLNLAVARAREILALMREGQVDGLSIGFRTQRATQDRKTGLRHLKQIDLWEISLVTFPMLPQARVTAVKRARPSADAAAGVVASLDCVAAKFARARWIGAAARVEAKLTRAARLLERRYSADQPRDEMGRWTLAGGALAATTPEGAVEAAVEAIASGLVGSALTAGDYSWGELVTQFDAGGRRICIYDFDFGRIAVDGSRNLGCQMRALSSAVSHGLLLNDN